MLSTKFVLATSLVASVAFVGDVTLTAPSPAVAHESGAYNNGGDLDPAGAWMTGLPDIMQLSWMSIPGTHDTASYPGVLTALAQTQSESVEDQLAAGIRALDIRVEHKSDGSFDVRHGPTDIPGVDLVSDILIPVNDFLRDNPGETVLFHVQKEGGDGEEADFWSDFESAASIGAMSLVDRILARPSARTTLGEARGKLVILDLEDNNTPDPGYDIFIDADYMQNEFEICNNVGVADKWIDIRDHFDATIAGDADRLYGNFLSGTRQEGCSFNPSPAFVASGHTTPSDNSPRLSTGHVTTCDDHDQDLYADDYTDCPSFFPHTNCVGDLCTVSYEGMNPLFEQLIATQNPTRTGIVWMDYPGSSVIQRIIEVNYRGGPQLFPPSPQELCADVKIDDDNEQDLDAIDRRDCHDGDDVDYQDNCLGVPNPNQSDIDGDGKGDWEWIGSFCDEDWDGDGAANDDDLCPSTATGAPHDDSDGDGIGDDCENPTTDDDVFNGDVDRDRVRNGIDNCRFLFNPLQFDLDRDGQGDVCDKDIDGDGTVNRTIDVSGGVGPRLVLFPFHGDGFDNCPYVKNVDQTNSDSSSFVVGGEQVDFGDACDLDDDNDGVYDYDVTTSTRTARDNCRTVFNPLQQDNYGTSLGDHCEDTDRDSVIDVVDNCPITSNSDQADTDGDGDGDACDALTIVGPLGAVDEGSTVNLTAISSGAGGPFTYEWDLDDDGQFDDGAGETVAFTAVDNDGVGVAVRQNDGGVVREERSSVAIANVVPSVDLSTDSTASSNPVTVTVRFADPGGADTHVYRVDWGDGASYGSDTAIPGTATVLADGSTEFALDHVYSAEQPRTVRVCVVDDDTGQRCRSIRIGLDVPVLDVETPEVVFEGETAVIWATAVADGSTVPYGAVLYPPRSGSPIESKDIVLGERFSFSVPFPQDRTAMDFPLRMCIYATDRVGEFLCEDVPVVVLNASPVATLAPIDRISEGGTVALDGSFTDPGVEDLHSGIVHWGDGTITRWFRDPGELTHVYPLDGVYEVRYCVYDNGGGHDCATQPVVVENVAPSLTVPDLVELVEGDEWRLTGTIDDPGREAFVITTSWGDDSPDAVSAAPISSDHVYVDDGAYQATVCVDDGLDEVCESVEVRVANAAPTATMEPLDPIEEGDSAELSGRFTDPGADDVHTATVDWGDGDGPVPLDLNGPRFDDVHRYKDDGTYRVEVCVVDDSGDEGCAARNVTVDNVEPSMTVDAMDEVAVASDAVVTGTYSDPGELDTHTATVNWGDGTETADIPVTGGTFRFTHPYGEVGNFGVEVCIDDGVDETCDGTDVDVIDPAPTVSASASSTGAQYSDAIAPVTVVASDVPGDTLTVTTNWKVADDVATVPGLPTGLALNGGCSPAHECSWQLAGEIGVGEGDYVVTVTVTDAEGDSTSVEIGLIVTAEDARADAVSSDVAVEVDGDDDDADVVSIVVEVTEIEPDLAATSAAAGDIGLADLRAVAVPVGPGGSVTGSCTPNGVSGTGYDAVHTLTCTFDDVPVNVYSVLLTIDGGYYTGAGEDMFVVYDPDLGFTTGGGWFYWPGTADEAIDYPGDRTNFGYTAKYKKNGRDAKGNLLVIRHLRDGSKYRLKSNAMDGLALGETSDFGWASFSGKATYIEPGWDDAVGNHAFTAYVEDRGEPGRDDRFWLEVTDKSGDVVGAFSLPNPATLEARTLEGGNIQVPQGRRAR